jgi:hypothetical protein
VTTSENALELQVQLGEVDVDAVVGMRTLLSSAETSYVAVHGATIDDMAGVACAQQAELITTFTDDAIAPVLQGFEVYMSSQVGARHRRDVDDSNRITILVVFSEKVDGETVDLSKMSITTATGEIALVGAFDVVNEPIISRRIAVMLSLADTLQVQADDTAFTTEDNSQIVLQSGFVHDPAGVPNAAGSSSGAGVFQSDNVPPTLASFELDMTTHDVTFLFSEIVRANTLEPTAFTLQYKQETIDSSNLVQLTGGNVSKTNGLTVT